MPLTPIDELKKIRFQFLHTIYEKADGSTYVWLDTEKLGKQLGLTANQTRDVDRYLRDEQLIKWRGDTAITLTHAGIRAVEEALSEPDKRTQYFPPVNIIHVENMHGSQIQQGTHHSTQTVTVNHGSAEDIQSFLQSLETSAAELHLPEEKQQDLQAEIDTIKAQLRTSTPKASIVTECLKSVRSILESVTAKIGAELLAKMMHINP